MHYDLVIRNATVIDGTRAPRYEADIFIAGGRIAAVGRLDTASFDAELDASGRIAAPGFIDAHTHDDRLMLSSPEMAPKVSQGVTTVVAGNCGCSLAPAPNGMRAPVTPPLDLLDDEGGWFRFATFREYVEELVAHPPATNCALLVGHTMLRVQTMDSLERPAKKAEIARMKSLADEALAAGAIGISTGLYYEPARGAPTDEVVQVCRPLAARNGLYVTHMRDEGANVLVSLEETFRIGREVGVPVVISHHKVAGAENHGRSRETLPLIEARMKSQKIGLDCYPYCASSTILSASRAAGASKTLVTWSKPHPEVAGMDLGEIKRQFNFSIEQLLPAGAIYFSMDEQDVQRILSFEHTMIGSDGLPHDAAPHPRLWSTFPRVLGHYARGLGLFPLETAVYKMTGLTARTFGLADRGVLAPGMAADITIFDPGTVGCKERPEIRHDLPRGGRRLVSMAEGIRCVIVNGTVLLNDGQHTGDLPGQALRP